MLIWISLSILSGLFTALSDVVTKVYIEKYKVSSLFALFVRWLFSSIMLIPLLYYSKNVEVKYIVVFIASIPIEILASYLYTKSIEIGEASEVLPFQSITPVFIPPIGYFFLGENYSLIGLAGILLVVAGGYITVGGWKKVNLPSLLKSIKNKGVLYMILCSLIYSVTSVLGRYMVIGFGPEFFASSYMISLTLCLSPFFIKNYGTYGIIKALKEWKMGTLLGFTLVLAIIPHFLSIKYLETAYMISLKRTSVIFSVILAYIILHESNFGTRLIGSILMFLGIVVISLSAM